MLISIWGAGIITCNSCQENEPGTIWIEFYSLKHVKKFLITIIGSLEEQIRDHPQNDDWLCYRILGYSGDSTNPWKYDAHPSITCITSDPRELFPRDLESCKFEFSVSLRFPVEDCQRIIELMEDHNRSSSDSFDDLTDDQWNYVKRYLPPQPMRGRKRTDDRRALNAILYILKTKCPWRRLPSQYGSSATARRRMEQWSSQGILDKILNEIDIDESYGGTACKIRENMPNKNAIASSVERDLSNMAYKGITADKDHHQIYDRERKSMSSMKSIVI